MRREKQREDDDLLTDDQILQMAQDKALLEVAEAAKPQPPPNLDRDQVILYIQISKIGKTNLNHDLVVKSTNIQVLSVS